MTELIDHFFSLTPEAVGRLMTIRISKRGGGWQDFVRFLQQECKEGDGSFCLNEHEYQRLQ